MKLLSCFANAWAVEKNTIIFDRCATFSFDNAAQAAESTAAFDLAIIDLTANVCYELLSRALMLSNLKSMLPSMKALPPLIWLLVLGPSQEAPAVP